MKLSTYSKSIALFLVEAQLWLAFVVHSKPQAVTATEWVMLAAVGVKTATVWLVPNTPAQPAPPPPVEGV